MRLIGIQHKSSGEILMVVPRGQFYKLPDGLTKDDVQIVSVWIPEIHEEMRMLTSEKLKEMQKIADERGIGVGDLVAAITTSTGFKKWWDEKHGGECTKCNEKQAVWNYYKFKGPSWISNWVNKTLKNN